MLQEIYELNNSAYSPIEYGILNSVKILDDFISKIL